ncbi:MAG TPA: hypothetical protein VFX93_10540 [Xanthomonadaceae bacterium]|jgi:uncharacterized Zn-binding protein involved in type VI secretion|nr:hypothetical protein [Xanthomonadaceae bacterium]
MGTPVVTIASTLLCAHGASASAIPGTSRVYANGAALLCVGDPVVVANCPAAQAQPRCTAIQLAGAARVRILGRAVALGSDATCEPNGLPAGVIAVSERVRVR